MSISGRRLPPAAVNVVGGIFVGRADELSVPETAAAAACRGQPQVVLVLVDDLQWTDRPSARALPFAVRPVAGRPDAGCGVSPPGELARLGEAAGPSPAARKLTSPAAERHLLCMSSRRKEKLMGEQPSATPDPAITPADSLAAPADSLTDLRGQMTVMKGEIDALKIASAQAGKPWYRQASVIIAVAALLFSMVSTYYADHLTTEQSKIASRSELGQLIQLLSALPEKDTELAAKYAGAPTTMISLRGDLAAESLVLAQHAADIIDRIPDQVSVTEYLSVAYPLVQGGVYARARALIDRGLRLPSDIRTREGLLRLKGKVLFIAGQPVQGGEQMQEALRLYRNEPPVVRAYAHALTESVWAGYEKLVRRCHEASVHLSRAQAAVAQMGASEYRDQVVGQVRAQAAVQCITG